MFKKSAGIKMNLRSAFLGAIFVVGINVEGYRNYFHMALQIEDAFDALSVEVDKPIIRLQEESGMRIKCTRNVSQIGWFVDTNKEYNNQGIRYLPFPIAGQRHPVADLNFDENIW